jgi:hypothetical protein
MPELSARPAEFWDTVAVLVTAKVEPVLGRSEAARAPVIAYLRDLEAIARQERQRPAALQIIASARRVLGDLGEILPKEQPVPSP